MNLELTIADLIFNRVLCVHPAKLELVLSVLCGRLHIVEAHGFSTDVTRPYSPKLQDEMPEMFGSRGSSSNGAQNWQDLGHGVALLPVSGSLVAKTRGLDSMSGLQSYRQIGNDFNALMNDDSVQHIVMQYDTPGGSVNTLPDLVDQLLAARGVKPVTALVDDMAYSAGYWLASAADEVIVSRTSGIGSIGAKAVHVDRSVQNEAQGIKITAVTSGSKKNLLSGDEPLSEDGLAHLQQLVDEMGTMFIEGAAANRGLKASVVRDMQAGTYMGSQGADVGLADRVMSANDALREIVGRYQVNRPAAPGGGRIQRTAKAMAIRSS